MPLRTNVIVRLLSGMYSIWNNWRQRACATIACALLIACSGCVSSLSSRPCGLSIEMVRELRVRTLIEIMSTLGAVGDSFYYDSHGISAPLLSEEHFYYVCFADDDSGEEREEILNALRLHSSRIFACDGSSTASRRKSPSRIYKVGRPEFTSDGRVVVAASAGDVSASTGFDYVYRWVRGQWRLREKRWTVISGSNDSTTTFNEDDTYAASTNE